MIKNLVELEHKIADKLYRFYVEANSDYTSAKQALVHFIKIIGNLEDAAVNASKNAQPESPPASPPEESKIEQLPIPEGTP